MTDLNDMADAVDLEGLGLDLRDRCQRRTVGDRQSSPLKLREAQLPQAPQRLVGVNERQAERIGEVELAERKRHPPVRALIHRA